MMEGEAFASWDARMVTLAGNAELLKSYGGDQNTFDEKLGRRLLAGLTGEDGRAIYEQVMWAQDNGEGQGHHILPLIRRIARTQATIKTRTKHLRVQAATAATESATTAARRATSRLHALNREAQTNAQKAHGCSIS